MNNDPPLCINCRHYEHEQQGPLLHRHHCRHPTSTVENRDPVTGMRMRSTFDAHYMRSVLAGPTQCGPEGKHHESEPVGVGFVG